MTGHATALGWVTARDGLSLAGAELDGVYLGDDGSPETIDPDLPVDLRDPDWDAATVHRLAYRDLSPSARAAFLVWHGHGRRAARAPVAWPLLHAYGLERRLLIDEDTDPALRQELRELGRVYGHDPEILRITTALGERPRSTARPPLAGGPVPDDLQVELGRRALASEPVTADWALAWAWYHPDIPRRDAATKATAEFAALWRHRFTESHPEGLIVAPRRRRLTLEYEPANPGLPSPLEIAVPDARDVFLSPAPRELLAGLTDAVEAELAAYVRWLDRFPHGAGTAGAVAVLPTPLLAGSTAERAAAPLVDYARNALGDAPATRVDAAALDARWREVNGHTEAGRGEAVALAQVLQRYDIGLEPDVRFGARALERAQAVLFRLTGDTVSSPSPAYARALVTLQLGVAVAASDGAIDGEEQALLDAQIDRIDGLDEPDRARLDAHRLLLAATGVDVTALGTRLATVDEDERRRLADHLVEVAWLDGVVTDGERRTVRATFELLGLDPAGADARLGAAPGVAATTDPAGLDHARLRDTEQDNAAVQDLLGAIFADDTDDTDDDGPPEPAPGVVLAGLDARHSGLLDDLARRQRSTRRELEVDAARHGVLPDGAIDVINEAALDLTDDVVLDVHDDESVSVDPAIHEEMSAA